MKKYSGRLTLRNNFHNTEAIVFVKNGYISQDSIKCAEKKLCGMSECICEEIRGTHETPQGNRVIVEKCQNFRGAYGLVLWA